MFSKARGYLKRRLPPSSRAFTRGVNDVLAAVQEVRAGTETERARLEDAEAQLRSMVEGVLVEVREGHTTTQTALSRLDRVEAALARLDDVEATLRSMEQVADTQGRVLSEALWAQVFNSTVASSEWLKDKAFSPGRWAVGYPYLYVLYRVLNEIRPRRVLELGLGQSTRMIAQYAQACDGVEHFVVEHDEKWIDFFSRSFRLPEISQLVKLDWEFVPHNEADAVRVYAGFSEAFGDRQFDLISIDGPLGGDMEHYARIDVLGLLPSCVAPSFVIMLDDYERDAESRTMREMRSALSEAGVSHRSCRYSGSKDVGVLCSADLGFLCSM